MATREGILGLAGKTRRAVESGEVQREELTPKGQLLFSLGVGSRQWDSLTRDEVLSLGVEMPPSLTERVTGAVGDAASVTGDYLSKLSGVVTEGIPAAARAFSESQDAPTLGQELRRRGTQTEPVFGGPPKAPTFTERLLFGNVPGSAVPGPMGLPADIPGLVDFGERVMRLPGSFGRAVAELGPEKAKPMTEAAAANLPFLGVRGPMAALASDIRGLRQAPRLLLPEAPKALPGRVGGMTPLPAERIPKTGMLPEGVSPKAVTGRVEPVKALPPPRLEMRPPHVSGVGPRPGAGRAFETAPPVAPRAPYGVVLDAEGRVISAIERPPEPGVVKARGIPAELDQVTPEGVRARVEALRPTTLPTAQETATRLDRPAPPPQTLAEQFAEAKAREGFVPKPVVPPPPRQMPKALPPATRRPFRQGAILAPESSGPGRPYGPPEPPAPAKLPPPAPVPPAAGPPPAPKAPLPSGPIGPPPKVPRPQRPKPDRVIDVGTVNLGDPDDVRILVRGFKGIRFGPEMAGEAEGVPFHLKEFKKGSGVAWDELVDEIARAQSRRPKDVERDLLRTLNRYKALKEDKRTGRILTVGPEGEPPPAPPVQPLHFEKTPIGMQAVVPGAEGRKIPDSALKAKVPQADIDLDPEASPLFFDKAKADEIAAREAAAARAQRPLFDQVEPPKAPKPQKPVDPDDPFGAKDILPDERGEPGEGGFGRAGLQVHLGSAGAGALIGGREGDTPEERWRNAVIGAAAGLVAPPAFKGLRAMGERGALGSEPPKVPPQFRREVVGRTPVPEVTPFDQMVPPEPPTSPAAKQAFRQSTQKVIQQAKAPETVPPIADEFAGMAGGNLPPRSVFTLPADIPGDPMPEASRAARFWRMTKRPFDYWNVPEEVVRGDPAGTAVVRLTYRRGEDGMRLKRELEDRARDVYRGLQAPEIEQINAVLDTPGIIPEQYPSLLPPRLAEAARRARLEIFDAGADATGLPRERRITGYFPRFRDTVRMEERKLVLNPQGEPYLERTFLGDIPQNFAKAFFHRTRTATDPPSRLGLDGVLIYQRATARHLTMQGGFHPITKEAIPGYLNELQGLIQQPVQEGLKPYLTQFVNDFLGATSKGAPLAHQASRIARNVEFSRSIGGNLASPLVNMTGQVNTYALVRPQSWVRGYFDMLNPQRRALAQRFIGLEELAKADLELVQQTITKLDRIEDFTGKLAHVSGTLFRASEKNGNRYHAFLAGLRDAEAEGLTGRAAIEYARDINDATQFLGSGPAKPFVFRGPVGAVVGQFKQFQMRQMFFAKNLIAQDIKDWNALLHGRRRVPIEIMGRTYRDPMTGEVFTRPARIFPRTAKYLIMLSAVGGPDAVWPGLEEYLQEKGVTVPGLLPAIGVGVNQMMGYGAIEPGDLTRSLLFYLPGPLLGHLQDMVSAARGIHYGRGLTELVNGDWGRELTLDERVDRALRGFLPVAGVAAARGRRALKQLQTPGEERAALTILEALGLQPAGGPILRRTAAGDPARTAIGLPPKRQEREFEERQRLTDLDAQANHIVKQAADLDAAGRGAEAERLLRDGERRLGLPPGTLELSKQGLKAAEQRREFTPLERRRFQMRNRFPTEVDRSRQRVPGIEPDEPPRLRRQRSR